MHLYAVSDLHISGNEDPLYLILLSLIRERPQSGDLLVLAGDLFDLFVGNKPIFTERYQAFVDELHAAGRRQVQIHYIEGNHDFHISQALQGVVNLTVHSDSFETKLDGKSFHFSHGDTVDRSDLKYLALRSFFRSPMMKALVTVTPGTWLDQIGQASANASRKRRPDLPARLPQGELERLRKIYRSYAAEQISRGRDYVVLGHCHDLDEMTFQVESRMGQYINIGFPRIHGSFLSWTQGDDKIRREKLPTLSSSTT